MAARNGKGATQEAPPEKKNDRPVWSRKLWTGTANCEVAVFAKIVNEGKDDEFTAYNVSTKRTFKTDEGYQSVQGFRSEDIPILISLLNQAHAFITDELNGRE
ncbi:MAG: hypothetical protein JWP89_2654 [Schlesneria sp.]|nr:hypothetical protein [Schlesneria sp.]